jgi:murein L,D-transpeptidase YcbB/YkuD
VAALNVSAAQRLAEIDANLERDRWLPTELPGDRLMVDLAQPDVRLFEQGRDVLDMRAAAGEPKKPTPTFTAPVTAVEFNPPWIVPPDIARSELFPKQRRHPGYFRRNDFYVSDGRLIQRAGPKSSLGYIKFDIADPFAIYLHDTPARSVFSRDQRYLSHGCVRLEKPRELADALLGWTPDRVNQAIADKATKTVRLSAAVPVFLVYQTVVADPDGKVTFRPDVYGWDLEIAAALAGRPQIHEPRASDTAGP